MDEMNTRKDLDNTWATLEFEFDTHPRTEVKLLRSSEEMIETLEENQVQLQNLLTSKYIEHFLEAVSKWQKMLSLADQIISVCSFLLISSQDLQNSVSEVRLVLKVTNREGLFPRLENLQQELTVCEKTLAEYLETKRLAFPRFYFVSTADLLDILSNGNQPPKITK
ncbi:hypothetical protein Anas_04769 [Armadillidium nasatum]|uniref:Dynein heavy chain linker domain-containing protein n=1 Tax=Armadillidium nasatum TaxID=96803 RepID=A0A5N5SJW6_9CRUS|nr:hypothetical protein Anas_04769 [Armadillidium nasatum]